MLKPPQAPARQLAQRRTKAQAAPGAARPEAQPARVSAMQPQRKGVFVATARQTRRMEHGVSTLAPGAILLAGAVERGEVVEEPTQWATRVLPRVSIRRDWTPTGAYSSYATG